CAKSGSSAFDFW
nr:immunoglobulin heavy chain junction region [Macaca mulatta]MOW98001.1 immunoglobulin heavy chain junction region [Macaca mulatta]